MKIDRYYVLFKGKGYRTNTKYFNTREKAEKFASKSDTIEIGYIAGGKLHRIELEENMKNKKRTLTEQTLRANYKRFFKNQTYRNILKEYFTREGDDIEEILVLNLFGDMLEAPVEEMLGDEVLDVVNKYRPIAEDLEKRLSKYFGKFPLTSHWSERIDNVMYDGSDAYQSPEEFRDDIPNIYDPQIEVVEELLDILDQAST